MADIMTYSRKKIKIVAPAGWTLIRDDFNPPIQQALYQRTIWGGDAESQRWTFNQRADAQGAVLLLDNAAREAPIEAISGSIGNGWQFTAKPVIASSRGDLVLGFYATDFPGSGLGPKIPANMSKIVDWGNMERSYWIAGEFQSGPGSTGAKVASGVQLVNWVAAQLAVKWANPADAEHCGGAIAARSGPQVD
ncbi:MAG: hypothetical protein ACREQI_12045 [Candidatus Binataceae bacterium]